MYATLKNINSLPASRQPAAVALGVKDISVSNAAVSNLMGNLFIKLRHQIARRGEHDRRTHPRGREQRQELVDPRRRHRPGCSRR